MTEERIEPRIRESNGTRLVENTDAFFIMLRIRSRTVRTSTFRRWGSLMSEIAVRHASSPYPLDQTMLSSLTWVGPRSGRFIQLAAAGALSQRLSLSG